MPDAITQWITGIHSDILTQIDLIFDNPLFYTLVILGLMVAGEKRNSKRKKIALAMIIALALGLLVNIGMAVDRPCADIEGAVCPMLYSFPSIHCTMAFILMISFLNKRPFPDYMLFAIFIAFSRIHLGVHVFRDVAGALIIGLIAYNITDILWKRWKKNG